MMRKSTLIRLTTILVAIVVCVFFAGNSALAEAKYKIKLASLLSPTHVFACTVVNGISGYLCQTSRA